MSGGCPLCGRRFDSVMELEAHVNTHFADEGPAQAPSDDGAVCPTCGLAMPADMLASHALAHQLEQEQAGAAAVDTAAARTAAEAADAEMAAALAAAEWGDDAAGGGGDSSDADDAAHQAAHQAHLEDLYFQELRAKYGFKQAPRPGSCHICGETGHWARDCDRNPDVQEAQRRVVDPEPALIAAAQQPARPTPMPGDAPLLRLLAACLEAQALPAACEYRAALCGPVQHFGATLYSSGWGCGWNNIQVMASHLLAARPDARAALFAGAGWVPDIASLQAWLEAAWRAGFDPQGAEQLEGRVQGTQKWVGTTEAAALLRSFGVRAQIVDFGVAAAERSAAAAAAAAAEGGAQGAGGRGGPVAVHPSCECAGCGQCPIRGDRYRSEALPDFDLCGACHAKGGWEAQAPFRRMMPAALVLPQHAQQGQQGRGGGGTMRDQLLAWVWRYFTADDAADTGAAAPGSSTMAAAAAAGGVEAPSTKRPRVQPPGRVHMSGKPPLYFQHEGHSRTIVGIERRLAGRARLPEFGLLVLDPGTAGDKLAAALAARAGWQRLLKRGAHTLRHYQYQLLHCPPGLAAGAELQALKAVTAAERY